MRVRLMHAGLWIGLVGMLLVRRIGLSRMLVWRHGSTSVRMNRLAAHVDGGQRQANTRRHTRTVDTEIDGGHTHQSGLARDAKQAGSLGGESAGAFETGCGNVPLGVGSGALADGDGAFWCRAATHRRTAVTTFCTPPVTTTAPAAPFMVVVVLVVPRTLPAARVPIVPIASVRVAVPAVPAIATTPSCAVVVVVSASSASVLVVPVAPVAVVTLRLARVSVVLVAVVYVSPLTRAGGSTAVLFIGISTGSPVSAILFAITVTIAVPAGRAVALLVGFATANFVLDAGQEGVGGIRHDEIGHAGDRNKAELRSV